MRRVTSLPMDIVIGDEGRLFVLNRASSSGGEVRRINWDDEDLGTFGAAGSDDGQFTWPVSMIRDREENLYISDEALNRISIFSREGDFLGKWGESGDGDGQLNRVSGIAFDPEENIYAADALNHRIQKFTKEGRFLGAFGSFGDGDGELNMPWGVTVDELGDVYVADWRNDRIQKFSADGSFLMKLGSSGDGEGQLNRPTGVEVDADGDIYVADRGNNRVLQFDQTGRYVDRFIGDATLSKIGRSYIQNSARVLRLREMVSLEPQKRFRAPTSVRIDDEGRLYITDFASHRIQVYKKEAYPLGPDEIMPEPATPDLITV